MSPNTAMFPGMWLFVVLYVCIVVGTIVIALLALWRGMRAQQGIERQLQFIAAALERRAGGS